MKMGKKQLQTLQKLSCQGKERCSLVKEDLIISLYLPEFWDAEFDDESLYYHQTPEYASAEAAFSQSMRPLLDAGLVEKKEQKIDTRLPDQTTSLCYRITASGSHELAKMR